MITFEYRKDQFGTKRPLAQVSYKIKSGKWIGFNHYIDSGADVTLIPLTVGQAIGLTAEGKTIKRIGGISGGIPVIYNNLKIKIGDTELTAQVAWAQVNNVPTLLGRKDIFDKFHITFKQDAGKIIFSEVS